MLDLVESVLERRTRPTGKAGKSMKYTAGEAAAATGLATSTITKAIGKGKISAVKDDNGAWSIDPAELHRVFPPKAAKPLPSPLLERQETPEKGGANSGLERLVETLQEQLADLRASNLRALADKDGVIHDLRADRDDWKEQAQRALTLLPVAAQPPSRALVPMPEARSSGQGRPVGGFLRRWLGLVPSND